MKKGTGLCPVFMIAALCLSGCGKVSMDVDANTLYVDSNGKLTEVIVEDFEKDYYDEDELKTYIDDAVESYQNENGKSDVAVKKYEVKNQVAKLLVEYDSCDSYAAFNETEIYVGTVLKAQAAGYGFDVHFYTPEQSGENDTETDFALGESTEEIAENTGSMADGVSADTVLGEDNNQVLILKHDTNVQVKGEILYVSEHVRVTGKNTAEVYGEGADSTDAGLAYIIYK